MHFVNVKGILSPQNGMNLYRGCTHGCIYCDSRSTCYQMQHAFTDVEVKHNAPELLEEALRKKRRPCMISTGSMSDPYNPCEEKLKLTRQCLEIIRRHGFGVTVLTKSDLILRDISILEEISRETKCVVQMTLTTYHEDLCRILEPNVCTTRRRYEVLKACQRRGIATVVWICPILPYLNDTEENLMGLLQYCIDAGVAGIVTFGMGATMREGSREPFYEALDRHFPGMKEKYIQQFGGDYVCPSPNEAALIRLLHQTCREHGIMDDPNAVFAYLREFPAEIPNQMGLFEP